MIEGLLMLNGPKQVSGTINAVNQYVSVNVENYCYAIVTMDTTSLSGHTVVFECSNNAKQDPSSMQWDGTSGSWYAVLAQRTNSITMEAGGTSLAAKPTYGWVLNVSGWSFLKIRASAHTSGSAVYTISLSSQEPCFLPNTSTAVSLVAGTNVIGDVGLSARATTGGLNLIKRMTSSAANANETLVKNAAGRLYRVTGRNTSASARYLKIYNKATAPVVASDTPILTLPLPPSSNFDVDFTDYGIYNSTGIGYAITAGPLDTDTTGISAGDIVAFNALYM